jgi:membrane protein
MTAMTSELPPGPDAGPSSPTLLSRQALKSVLRRTVKEFDRDNAWDWAASLTYYGVLSIFPGLVVIVSLVGLVGRRPLEPVLDSLTQVAPGAVRDIITTSVTGLQNSSSKAGAVAVIGVLVALWSASGYVAAFMRASNAIYDVPEGRPLWKKLPIRLIVTMAAGVLLVASAFIVVVSGGIATALGRALGLEQATLHVWAVSKWPLLVVLVGFLFDVLYWASPNARQGGFRWVSPGGVLAVALWIIASVLFGVYAAHFSSYDKTYGTLAGVIVLLVWLWISNLAILLGAELDAELERQRAIAAGMRPANEPYMRLRDDRAVEADRDPGLAEWDRPSRTRHGPSMIGAAADPDEGTLPAPAVESPEQIRHPAGRSLAGRVTVAGIGGALLGAAMVLWVSRRNASRPPRRSRRRANAVS